MRSWLAATWRPPISSIHPLPFPKWVPGRWLLPSLSDAWSMACLSKCKILGSWYVEDCHCPVDHTPTPMPQGRFQNCLLLPGEAPNTLESLELLQARISLLVTGVHLRAGPGSPGQALPEDVIHLFLDAMKILSFSLCVPLWKSYSLCLQQG